MGVGEEGRESPLTRALRRTDVVRFVQDSVFSYEPKEVFVKRSDIPKDFDPEFAWELVSFVRCVNGRPTIRSRTMPDGNLRHALMQEGQVLKILCSDRLRNLVNF